MAQQAVLAKHKEEERSTQPTPEIRAPATQITSLTEYTVKGRKTPPPALQELLSLEARNTTLLALGGPDGNTIDPHCNWWASHPTVLAKAIRGAWRWWLRTLLQHEYKAENYQRLWEIEEALGLGSTSKATCYIIEVEPEISREPLSPQEIQKTLIEIIDEKKLKKRKEVLLDDLSGQKRKVTLRIDENIVKEKHENYTEKLIIYMLTRLRYYVLLTMPYKLTFRQRNRRELENLTPEKLVQKLVYKGEHLHKFLYRKQPLLPGQLTIKITLYRRKAYDPQKKRDICATQIDDLAKKALIYALTIGGIGAATTRGFGKFTIIIDKKSKNTEENNKKKSNEAQQIQREIIQQYKAPEEVEELKENTKKEKQDKQELPSLPDINKAVKIKIAIHLSEAQDILDILAKISDAVRKYEWKAASRKLKLTRRPPRREHGDRYHTWVLGLPRSVGFTGYFINITKPGRWKSPLIFTPIHEDGGWKILITLFPLKDAEHLLHTPSYQLYWRGKYIEKEVRSLKLLTPSGQKTRWTAEDTYRAALKWITEILESG